MAIVHPCSIAKTQTQEQFEIECEAAYPNHFDFHQSDLYRGDYQDEQTRYAYAGYKLAKGIK